MKLSTSRPVRLASLQAVRRGRRKRSGSRVKTSVSTWRGGAKKVISGASALLLLDLALGGDLAPALGFLRQEAGEVRRRHAARFRGERVQELLGVRCCERPDHLRVKTLHDRRRRAARNGQAGPVDDAEPRQPGLGE